MLDPSIAARLAIEDDLGLWDLVTNTILADAAQMAQDSQEDIYAQVGCCCHWIRPHWRTFGGFPYPFGYDKTTTGYSFSALPELEWSCFFEWTGTTWEPGRTGTRCLVLRVAIPARTTRHFQAAIHTIWTPRSPLNKEKTIQLYGFRKKKDNWQLTATSIRGKASQGSE